MRYPETEHSRIVEKTSKPATREDRKEQATSGLFLIAAAALSPVVPNRSCTWLTRARGARLLEPRHQGTGGVLRVLAWAKTTLGHHPFRDGRGSEDNEIGASTAETSVREESYSLRLRLGFVSAGS